MILPFSGFEAISREVSGKTLELVFLTRLSALRIVIGKWASIVTLTFLSGTAVLPYVVLRYFTGGIDLWEDLKTLAWILAISMVLTAGSVGVSAFPAKIARSLLLIAFPIVGYQIVVEMMSLTDLKYLAPPVTMTSSLALLASFYAFLGTLFMFEIGASRIAPPAENHSTAIRLIGVAIFISTLLAVFVGVDALTACGLSLLLLFPMCIGLLCESIKPMPSVYRPFVRRGIPGRFVGVFLYPGWPSGVALSIVFVVGTVAGYWNPVYKEFLSESASDQVIIALFLGAAVLPFGLIRVFLPRVRKVFVTYIFFQALSIVPFCIYYLAQAFDAKIDILLSFFPLSLFIALTLEDKERSELLARGVETHIALTLCAVCLLFLLFSAANSYRQIRALEKEAGESLAKASGS